MYNVIRPIHVHIEQSLFFTTDYTIVQQSCNSFEVHGLYRSFTANIYRNLSADWSFTSVILIHIIVGVPTIFILTHCSMHYSLFVVRVLFSIQQRNNNY